MMINFFPNIISDIFYFILNCDNIVISNLETIVIFYISIVTLGAIILFSINQLDKMLLEGLYATAAENKIDKSAYDVYKAFKGSGSISSNDNGKHKESKINNPNYKNSQVSNGK